MKFRRPTKGGELWGFYQEVEYIHFEYGFVGYSTKLGSWLPVGLMTGIIRDPYNFYTFRLATRPGVEPLRLYSAPFWLSPEDIQ